MIHPYFTVAASLIGCLFTYCESSAAPDLGPVADRGGLAVLLHPDTAESPGELKLSSRFTIHCLSDNEALVTNLQKADDTGFSAEHWRLPELPHADNLVNLLVVYRAGSVPAAEIKRVLTPLGIAWIRNGRKQDLLAAGLKLVGKPSDAWLRVSKDWPTDIDEWTHFMHGPDGNGVANDTRIADPRSMQWTAGPDWAQHHNRPNSLSAMVSARGRLYHIHNNTPPSSDGLPDRWALSARDAFNGVLLWSRSIENWGWKSWSDKPVADGNGGRFTQPPHIARTLVAAGDTIYVTLGFGAPVSAIDGRTGEIIRSYAGTENTDEILVADGRLYLAVHDQSLKERTDAEVNRRRKGEKASPSTKRMMAVNAATGSILWEGGSHVGISEKQQFMEIHRHLNPVLGDGKIFFATRTELVCLNAETGKEAWRRPRPAAEEHLMRYQMRATDMVTLVYHSGHLFFSQLEPTKRVGWRDVKATIHAFSTNDGKPLWNRVCASWGWGSPADVLITQGLVWVHEFKTSTIQGIDPATGKVLRTTSNKIAFDDGHHHRCYRNKATSNFLLTSYRGVELIDWDNQRETSLNHWFRAACRYGLLPANGLLYNSPNPCSCYIESKLNGFNALAPATKSSTVANADRLSTGPAFGMVKPSPAAADDWPVFRHDNRRSGTSSTVLSARLSQAWDLDLGGVPTAPIIANGLVHVAVPKTRQLIAVHTRSGRTQWRITTSGQVDSPPTWHKGTLVYGTSDGHVVCRRARDGALVWRFLAAPSHRRIMAHGKLESSWPVHGSVVVEGDQVYALAGRSSFLDGGFSGWILNAETGAIIDQVQIDAESEAGMEGKTSSKDAPGMTSDLLVSNGRTLFLRGRTIFLDVASAKKTPLLQPVAGFLDQTWFNRASHWKCGEAFCGETAVTAGGTVFSFSAYKRRGTDTAFYKPGNGTYELSAGNVIVKDLIDRRGRNKGPQELLKAKWKLSVPVAARALLHAGGVVIVGGSPDTVDNTDPWKVIEGRGPGMLLVVSATDGVIQADLPLESPPVLDGMAAAGGRLFVASQSGKLICLESLR